MCPTFDTENGSNDSDIQPKISSEKARRGKAIYIDDALSKIKFGKFNYILIVTSGINLFAVVLEMLGISFVLPVSQCDLNFTTKQKGILSTVVFLGIICSSHLWGYLADTKGRRLVMLPTLLVGFTLSVCSSFTSNFYILVTLRFLNGFFVSASSATIYAYVGEFHDDKQRSRAIMGATIIYGVACVLIPLIAWSVINQDWMFYIPLLDIVYKPWRLFLIVCALPGLFASIALFFLPESPKYVLAQGNQDGALEILKKINRWNNGKNASFEVYELREEFESIENRRRILENKNSRFPLIKSVWEQTAPLFRPPYLGPTLLVCIIQFFIYAVSNGLNMWYPDILNRIATQNVNDHRIKMCEIINMPMNTSTSPTDEECITKLELDTVERGIVFEVVFALGLILIGLLINRVGKFYILITVLAVCGVAGISCAFIDIPRLSTSAFITLLLCGMAGSVISSAIVEIFPTNFRAMATSISSIFGRLGSIAGSNVIALLIDNYCDEAFLLFGFTLIVAGILTFFIPKIHEKPSKSENVGLSSRISITSC